MCTKSNKLTSSKRKPNISTEINGSFLDSTRGYDPGHRSENVYNCGTRYRVRPECQCGVWIDLLGLDDDPVKDRVCVPIEDSTWPVGVLTC